MLVTKYAIIEIGSRQFMLKEGDSFKIFKNSEIKDFKTLLIKDENTVEIGTPVIAKGGVSLVHTHDKKIKTDVRRFKGKSRYRVNKSHSDDYSFYTVNSIQVGQDNIISTPEEGKPVIVNKKETVVKKPKSVKKAVKKTPKVKKESK